MNLLADESIEREVVQRLRADGHATIYIAELSPSITDDQVLAEANARSALLVTADNYFGELVYRLGRIHVGVVLNCRHAPSLLAYNHHTFSRSFNSPPPTSPCRQIKPQQYQLFFLTSLPHSARIGN
jgi:predicted nuclease of predicted toxin-antitoxin system